MADGDSSDPRVCVVIGDVGGTNARFERWEGVEGEALERVGQGTVSSALCSSYADAISKTVGAEGLDLVVIAVCGPVLDEREFVGPHLPHQPPTMWVCTSKALEASGLAKRVVIINDFQAIGYALPVALRLDLATPFLSPPTPAPRLPLACLGPGTGLGACGVVRGSDGASLSICSESGMVEFAARSERELRLKQHVAKELEAEERASGPHVTVEDIVSGTGLPRIFRFVKQEQEEKSGGEEGGGEEEVGGGEEEEGGRHVNSVRSNVLVTKWVSFRYCVTKPLSNARFW